MPQTTTVEHVAEQFLDAAEDAARAAERMQAAWHGEHELADAPAVPSLQRFRASLERKPQWDVDPCRVTEAWMRPEAGHIRQERADQMGAAGERRAVRQ
jgi:hypothetical protein